VQTLEYSIKRHINGDFFLKKKKKKKKFFFKKKKKKKKPSSLKDKEKEKCSISTTNTTPFLTNFQILLMLTLFQIFYLWQNT